MTTQHNVDILPVVFEEDKNVVTCLEARIFPKIQVYPKDRSDPKISTEPVFPRNY